VPYSSVPCPHTFDLIQQGQKSSDHRPRYSQRLPSSPAAKLTNTRLASACTAMRLTRQESRWMEWVERLIEGQGHVSL
jgi:hypothetical protein